jgi:hypothetical protein
MIRYSIPFLLQFKHCRATTAVVIEIAQAISDRQSPPASTAKKCAAYPNHRGRRQAPAIKPTRMPIKTAVSQILGILNKLGDENVTASAKALFVIANESESPKAIVETLSEKTLEQDVLIAPLFGDLWQALISAEARVKPIYLSYAKARFDKYLSEPVDIVKLSAAMVELAKRKVIYWHPVAQLVDSFIENLSANDLCAHALSLIHEASSKIVEDRSRLITKERREELFKNLLRMTEPELLPLFVTICNAWPVLPDDPFQMNPNISLKMLNLLVRLRLPAHQFTSHVQSVLTKLRSGDDAHIAYDDVMKLLVVVEFRKVDEQLRGMVLEYATENATNKNIPARTRFKLMDMVEPKKR